MHYFTRVAGSIFLGGLALIVTNSGISSQTTNNNDRPSYNDLEKELVDLKEDYGKLQQITDLLQKQVKSQSQYQDRLLIKVLKLKKIKYDEKKLRVFLGKLDESSKEKLILVHVDSTKYIQGFDRKTAVNYNSYLRENLNPLFIERLKESGIDYDPKDPKAPLNIFGFELLKRIWGGK